MEEAARPALGAEGKGRDEQKGKVQKPQEGSAEEEKREQSTDSSGFPGREQLRGSWAEAGRRGGLCRS